MSGLRWATLTGAILLIVVLLAVPLTATPTQAQVIDTSTTLPTTTTTTIPTTTVPPTTTTTVPPTTTTTVPPTTTTTTPRTTTTRPRPPAATTTTTTTTAATVPETTTTIPETTTTVVVETTTTVPETTTTLPQTTTTAPTTTTTIPATTTTNAPTTTTTAFLLVTPPDPNDGAGSTTRWDRILEGLRDTPGWLIALLAGVLAIGAVGAGTVVVRTTSNGHRAAQSAPHLRHTNRLRPKGTPGGVWDRMVVGTRQAKLRFSSARESAGVRRHYWSVRWRAMLRRH